MGRKKATPRNSCAVIKAHPGRYPFPGCKFESAKDGTMHERGKNGLFMSFWNTEKTEGACVRCLGRHDIDEPFDRVLVEVGETNMQWYPLEQGRELFLELMVKYIRRYNLSSYFQEQAWAKTQTKEDNHTSNK